MAGDGTVTDILVAAPVAGLDQGLEKNHQVTLHAVAAKSEAEGNIGPDGHVIPTEEELATLPKIAGVMPTTAYLLCAVEFAERASYYGCKQVFKNFVRGPLPEGGNGAGAPPRGSQSTAGALGKGTSIAGAMTDSFTFLAYALPIWGGWLADKHWGRFRTICWGVAICGVAHVIMVIAAIPSIIQAGTAIGPFALSIYMLAIGASMFKPNIAPTLLDQNPHKKPHVVIQKDGSKAIIDPEATSESVMLWFYLLINIGAFTGVATSYLAKYVGFWPAYLMPGILYLMLPPLLWYLNKRLIKLPPGGSDLGNFIKVNLLAFKSAGIRGVGRKGYWDRVKPSNLASTDGIIKVTWDDQFVDDVRRTVAACAIFLFFPIQQLNDGGIGAAANAQSASLTSNGVPNDVLDNMNPLAIIVLIPIMNNGVYPLLRRFGIRFGPISRITFGLLLASIGAIGYVVIQDQIYKTSPCGKYATDCEVNGEVVVSPLSLWLYAIPTVITACSEVFINVTAYGIAYSRAPKNMRGFVMALSLFMTAISTAISLAVADVATDPNLVWIFLGPCIAGFIATPIFYFSFRHLDDEDFFVHVDDVAPSALSASDEESKHGETSNAQPKLPAYTPSALPTGENSNHVPSYEKN